MQLGIPLVFRTPPPVLNLCFCILLRMECTVKIQERLFILSSPCLLDCFVLKESPFPSNIVRCVWEAPGLDTEQCGRAGESAQV